ncbi:hypothetical protein K1X12_10385 [Hyphomonas sp. WL0036]|uniref:hypothetical protein n=1 Tax=Hyphomonas sediminis TaxID=2866160 RepID=UPI001C7E506D|nr:hypothetical protein [Hyphomonas sediminis]MBY9067309.1 hypothetical protein [Hyphomonas sediminis]
MAETRGQTLKRFFDLYAQASLAGDIETIAAAYAPTYIESSPDSFAAWKVDDAYRIALTEREKLMKTHLGLSGLEAELVSAEEVAPLHYLVTVRWSMTFDKARTGRVTSTFLGTYVVKMNGRTEILAYLSHESEETVMRRDGVI